MAKKYNFKDVQSGKTFKGVQFRLVINKVAKDLTNSVIVMTVGSTVYSTTNGAIVLSDPANGKFQFKKQVISLAAGVYQYSISITFSDGDTNTYIEGYWRIL